MIEQKTTCQAKKRILIAVYNDISRDARVQRQIDALSSCCSIDVLCSGALPIENVTFIPISQGDVSYSQYVRKFISVIRKNPYDVIYGNDYYSCLPMLVSGCGKKAVSIYDAHELIIDCTEPRERFFKWMERLLIKRVSHVICASEQRSEIMKDYYQLPTAPYVVRNISKLIPNGDVTAASESEVLNTNDIKIIYAGVLKKGRKIELLCKAAQKLGDGYSVIIVGDGEQSEFLNDLCRSENITNVHFFGGKKSTDLGNYIGRCDIGYLYYPCTDMNNTYCAPNKIYEYTSLGVPFVTNDNPTMVKEVNEFGLGAVFEEKGTDEETIGEIQRAILAVSENMADFRRRALEFADNYSWEKEAMVLQDVVTKGY